MSRGPPQKSSKPRAFCTFCKKPRALNTVGMPLRHKGPNGDETCKGTWHTAQPCPSCAGTNDTAECLSCEGTGKVIK